MKKKYKFVFLTLVFLGMLVGGTLYLIYGDVPVLHTKGIIAHEERDLMTISTLLMLIVVIPVFVLGILFTWKYRAQNKKANYDAEWDESALAEGIWWGIPFLIVTVLAVIAWKSTHALDPYKPIGDTKPLKIQVVALQWKWLFIYPEQKIASVNVVQFPEKTPVHFELTSDAPMNSFWVPQLSGQIFAMSGMKTQLHLMADGIGDYRGSSANISGTGFAGMTFMAESRSQADFDNWVDNARKSSKSLHMETYKELAKPSENDPISFYSVEDDGLFDWIVMKYMMPCEEMTCSEN